MRKTVWLAILLAAALVCGSMGAAGAEVLPPYGEGQIGLTAVVLCEQLTLRAEPSASAAALQTVPYGSLIIVTDQADGWARCVLGDAEDSPAGWVRADYIAIDPAWYRAEKNTPVYAWGDTAAPKVALLDGGTVLPILKDGGEWLIVSLRGAAGWIRMANRAAAFGRRDGERFEQTILLEGMEETVRYEHIVSNAGFAMDYDYESFARLSGADGERFTSVWDDPAQPENYLEITWRDEGADDAAEDIAAELTRDYDISTEAYVLDRAGSCIRIEASAVRGTNQMAERLQVVYIIPAGDGCLVATEHFFIEGAEGFGQRFSEMLNTLEVIGR